MKLYVTNECVFKISNLANNDYEKLNYLYRINQEFKFLIISYLKINKNFNLFIFVKL